jgi:predicted aminopeptidase
LYEQRKSAFIDLVMKYRSGLNVVYAGTAPDAEKRRKKAETFAALKAEYQALKSSWGGYAGYDRFFADELNNAHLVPVATYSELVPGFRRVLAENGGDFRRFYAAVRELGKLPEAQRHAKLKAG